MEEGWVWGNHQNAPGLGSVASSGQLMGVGRARDPLRVVSSPQ